MLTINYKAAYNLLEPFYQRRSLHQIVFGYDTPENIFEASKVAAMALEDYDYLDVMVSKREDLDKKFSLFIDGIDYENLPIVLEKDKDLNLLEFVIVSLKCNNKIDPKLFHSVIESQAESKQKDARLCIELFDSIRKHFLKTK